MITPNAMPRKANALHQQLLAGLIATKPEVWNRKTLVDPEDPKSDVAKTRVTRQLLSNPLAQNVSELNVDRAAQRWLR